MLLIHVIFFMSLSFQYWEENENLQKWRKYLFGQRMNKCLLLYTYIHTFIIGIFHFISIHTYIVCINSFMCERRILKKNLCLRVNICVRSFCQNALQRKVLAKTENNFENLDRILNFWNRSLVSQPSFYYCNYNIN